MWRGEDRAFESEKAKEGVSEKRGGRKSKGGKQKRSLSYNSYKANRALSGPIIDATFLLWFFFFFAVMFMKLNELIGKRFRVLFFCFLIFTKVKWVDEGGSKYRKLIYIDRQH